MFFCRSAGLEFGLQADPLHLGCQFLPFDQFLPRESLLDAGTHLLRVSVPTCLRQKNPFVGLDMVFNDSFPGEVGHPQLELSRGITTARSLERRLAL